MKSKQKLSYKSETHEVPCKYCTIQFIYISTPRKKIMWLQIQQRRNKCSKNTLKLHYTTLMRITTNSTQGKLN